MARYRVALTESAERDLEELIDFQLEYVSAAAAARLLKQVSARIDSLETFPDRGPCPKELAALGIRAFRQLNFGVHRMIYRVSGNNVHVMLIADGRRDMTELLQRRLLSG